MVVTSLMIPSKILRVAIAGTASTLYYKLFLAIIGNKKDDVLSFPCKYF